MNRNHGWSYGAAKLLAFSALTALLLQGCGDDNRGSRVVEQGPEIFPLSTGNRWVYNWGLVDSIRTSVEINGETWFEMGALSLVITRNPTLVRMNADNQLMVKEPEGEFVLFDFGAEVGAEWDYTWYEPSASSLSYKVALVSNTRTVEVPFGTFEECYEFYFDASSACDASWCFWIAEGTGIVMYAGGYGITRRLTEFRPGGQHDAIPSHSDRPLLAP